MPTCGTDAQQWSSEYLSEVAPSDVNDDETSEKFMNFWSNLPGTTQLKNQGIDRIQRKKSNALFNTALSDLVGATSTAETKKQVQLKQHSETKSARSALLLDTARFKHTSYSKSPICNDLHEFLHSAPRTWAAELKAIQSDLGKKLQNRAECLKPKIVHPAIGGDMTNYKTSYRNAILLKTSAIQMQAMRQTISGERKKEIKSEISDMDLWNRPLFFIKPHLDPIAETESTVSMCDSLMKRLSQETCDYLQKSEPEFSATGHIIYKPDEVKKLPKTKLPSGTSYFHTRVPTPRIRRFQPEKTISKSYPSPSQYKPTEEDASQSQTDNEGKDNLPESDTGNESFDAFADNGFGLNFLKDFVSFQEESAWMLNDDEKSDESTTLPQSN